VCDQLLRPDPRTRLVDWPAIRTELVSLFGDLGETRHEPLHTPDAPSLLYFDNKASGCGRAQDGIRPSCFIANVYRART
jgi:hypothetical protein